MPTYEYQCNGCGHEFEEFQSITAKPIRKCPACSANKVKRLIGCGSVVIFKGSGFYQTDYRSDSYKKAAQADKDSVSKSAGKSTDSKSSDNSKSGSGKSSDSTSSSSKSNDSKSKADSKSSKGGK